MDGAGCSGRGSMRVARVTKMSFPLPPVNWEHGSEPSGEGTGVPMQSDEQEILKLFEEGDRALMAADLGELSRIFADDYVQYDECGKTFTTQDVIDTLRSGKIRFVSMISTGRRIRLLRNDVAVVHGSEEDKVEKGGRCLPVRYTYMDVVMKRNGKWQIVESQLAKCKLK